MRNLKKVIALVLAVALTLSTFTVAFAAEATSASKLSDLGLLLNTTEEELGADLTRDIGLAMILKALGWDQDAANEKAASNPFEDVTQNWFKGYAGLAVEEGITTGKTATLFAPKDVLTQKEFVAFMLRALGYDTEKAWDEAADLGAAAGLVEAGNLLDAAVFTKADAADVMFAALKAELQGEGAEGTLADALIAAGAFTEEQAIAAGVKADKLDVTSIKASSAKSFVVTFNKAVKEGDKVTFAVKRLTTDVAVTTTWNEANTVATLASAANLPESSFTVAVLADEKEIAKETISITAQKIARIEITSDKLPVTVQTNTGYVNYKVYDQYDNDITNTAKANSLTPQIGLAGVTPTLKNGLMKIDAGLLATDTKLITIPALSIVLYDSTAGVTATKSLPISTAVGTLSSFTLGSADDIKLVEGDTTTVFYLPYTATDMSGNETKDYELISGGLIDSAAGGDVDLVVSLSTNVTATVVKDPLNSKNAAIAVKYTGTSNFVMDMPVTITAMTYGGNSSVVTTTLAKAKNVETVLLMAPADTVGAGETPEIPFEAYDQNGNKVTSYRYVNSTTITPNGFTIVEKSDGTAKFVMTAAGKGIVTLSANVVKSGKVSNLLTINVQDAAKPTSLGFKQDKLVGAMEQKATQKIVVSGSKRALVVYDQYDRVMSDSAINTAFAAKGTDAGDYYVMATVTGDATLNATATAGATTYEINSAADLYVIADDIAGGYATIRFELFEDLVGAVDKSLDTASTALSIVATKDIVGYQINSSESAIYTSNEANGVAGSGTITAQEGAYSFNAKVYGETSNRTKVLLAGNPVAHASVSNGNDFHVTNIAAASAYNAVNVTANKLDNNRTESKTDLIVTVAHNNTVKPLKVEIASSTTAPVAKEINFEGLDSNGNYDWTKGTGDISFNIQAYVKADGTATVSPFYFYIDDSYESDGMYFTSFNIAQVKNAAGTNIALPYAGASITNDGILSIVDASTAVGDVIYITAVTNNGLSSTIKVTVK